MIFDTDVLIWVIRGHRKAARLVDGDDEPRVSIISVMELMRGARDKSDKRKLQNFVGEFQVIPLSENIGHRASIYIEQLALKSGIEVADALIAATAAESGLLLASANARHYRQIPEVALKVFRP